MTDEQRQRRFSTFAWASLAYTFGVILFGAWVRISGSGAGCGQHWPTCHGEVVHLPQQIETMIEMTHRLTSGVSLILAIVLMVWALLVFPARHPARIGGILSLVFMISEALVGAALVLLALVGLDDSAPRAIVMAIHLSNTCLLTGAMALAAWGSRPGAPLRLSWTKHNKTALMILGAMACLVLVSMTGAVTALGDTLYPVHQAADTGGPAHFLQRLRIVHPFVAVASALLFIYAAVAAGRLGPECRRIGNVVAGLALAQVCAGVVNIMLSAPGWMQVLHLGLATILWISLVLLALVLTD